MKRLFHALAAVIVLAAPAAAQTAPTPVRGTIAEVTAHLREVAGKHLDPVFVELLINNIDKAVDINSRWPD